MGRDGSGVRQATKCSFQIEFLYQGVRCRERVKFDPNTTSIGSARKAAEQFREAILYAIKKGSFVYLDTFPESKMARRFINHSDLTVSEWLDKWMERAAPRYKASAARTHVRRIAVLNRAAFSSTPLAELKRKDVKQWAETTTTTSRAVNDYLSTLKLALAEAVEDELIPLNPLLGYTFTRNEPPNSNLIDPLSADEREAVLSNMADPQVRNFFEFAFWTGLRTSELVALEWSDIDFVKATISVTKAKTMEAEKAEKTKTKRGTRSVILLPPAREAMIRQKELTGDGTTVFLNPRTNKPWRGAVPLHKEWGKAIRLSGVRYRRPYQTRHTFASMMLTAGEPLAWVSTQLGHSSVVITGSTYATWIPNSSPDLGMKAVSMFSKSVL